MASLAAVAALVAFLCTVLATVALVLVPVRVRLPAWPGGRRCGALKAAELHVSYAWAPVLGALAMLATGALDGDSLARGIVGDDRLKPYGIVILFMALAYMSSSLDMTGCFQWLALQLTRLSRGNGLALFLLYYALSSVITVFSSNDVSIMALTPIIYYFALATSADPLPFLTAEFTAANIWSMLLFVGNPTNIIVSQAFRFSFFEYSKWMALPTLGAGLAGLLVVLALHHRSIPKRLALPQLQPAAMLVDVPGAVLGSANILACLALLAAAPALRWEMWAITLVCAVLHGLYNFVAYVLLKHRWCRGSALVGSAGGASPEGGQAGAASPCGSACGTVTVTQVKRDQHQAAACSSAVGSVELMQQRRQPQQCAGRADGEAACQASPTAAAAAAAAAAQHVQEGACRSGGVPDVQVTIEDLAGASLSSSRSCSCRQLLSEQQRQACSDALAAGSSTGQLASCSICRRASSPGSKQPDSSGAAPAGDGAAAGGCSSSSSSGSRGGGGGCGLLRPPPPPSFWRVLAVLPWEVVPFVLGMFCVVEGLNANGWVDSLAAWLAAGLRGSMWAALLGVGGLSVLLANAINNQPMTILMTRVCLSPAFVQALSSGPAGAGAPAASAFAVVVASNTAANFSVMGALAGIMFVSILQQRGMRALGYARFSRLMLPAGVASTAAALVVLGAEFAAWDVHALAAAAAATPPQPR